MVENFDIGQVRDTNNIYAGNYTTPATASNEDFDTSIFSGYINSDENTSENTEILEAKLDEIEKNNGTILGGWNSLKETLGIGSSAEKCDEAIEKYKNGEITFEEAETMINEYGAKQESSLNLFSNIATSIAAIGTVAAVTATIATGGLLAPVAIALGAGSGALTKAGFKALDRATNEVEGDALNGKTLAKDALSGAVTGGVAVWTMGTAGSANSVGQAIKGCTKTGVKSGAIAGAANYSIDCAFDENKDFNAGDLAKTTAESAIVGGAVGAIMGGVNGGLHASGALKSGCSMDSMISAKTVTNINDVAANSACTTSYKVLNDRIRAVAA